MSVNFTKMEVNSKNVHVHESSLIQHTTCTEWMIKHQSTSVGAWPPGPPGVGFACWCWAMLIDRCKIQHIFNNKKLSTLSIQIIW